MDVDSNFETWAPVIPPSSHALSAVHGTRKTAGWCFISPIGWEG
jgi:hypothetical protein